MNEVTILLFKDGESVIALLGDSLQDGTSGVGKNSADALRNLATQLEEEGVVEEVDSWL